MTLRPQSSQSVRLSVQMRLLLNVLAQLRFERYHLPLLVFLRMTSDFQTGTSCSRSASATRNRSLHVHSTIVFASRLESGRLVRLRSRATHGIHLAPYWSRLKCALVCLEAQAPQLHQGSNR